MAWFPEAPIAPASSRSFFGKISRHQAANQVHKFKSFLLLRRPLTKYFQYKISGCVLKNKSIFSFIVFLHTPQHQGAIL